MLNIERVEKLIEYLERDDVTLCRGALRDENGERCALGHAAVLAGIDPASVDGDYKEIYDAYGFTETQGNSVFSTNDAPEFRHVPEERKRAVIALLRKFVAEARGGNDHAA